MAKESTMPQNPVNPVRPVEKKYAKNFTVLTGSLRLTRPYMSFNTNESERTPLYIF